MRYRGQSGYTLTCISTRQTRKSFRLPDAHQFITVGFQEKELKKTIAVVQISHKAGFSMVEMAMVLTLACILAGFAVLNINGISPGTRANAALHQTVAQLRMGRESAIAQRRNVELKFLGNNQIQLVRNDMPAGTTILSTVTLEGSMQFRLFDGLPDTPDLFGKAAALSFGGANSLIFQSNGILVDSNSNPLNGTVFLGQANHPETARAVTILGATGRVRGYRWTGTSWIQ
jgi:prepilin-type N-terminal cleavage/methylation domain-containing protein